MAEGRHGRGFARLVREADWTPPERPTPKSPRERGLAGANHAARLAREAAANAGDSLKQIDEEARTRHWRLSPTQRAFIECAETFSFYVGGIGAGKTFAGCVRAIITALDPAYAGSIGVIAAPTYPMLEDATLVKFFELMPAAAIAKYDKSRHILTTTNNTIIYFRSLDKPDRLRGTTIAWFWIDEAPIGGYYSWEVLKGRARQLPYAIKGWATGTPRGQDAFYDAFENPEKKLDDHRIFHAPTWENAANLPADYIKNLNYSDAFYRQEVEGRFEAFEGLVYPEFLPQLAPVGHLRSPRKDAVYPMRIGGVDWGFNHPTAVLPIGIDAQDRAHVLEEYVESGKTIGDIMERIVDFSRRYDIQVWWCDGENPQLILEANRVLDQAGVNAIAKAADKGHASVIAGIQAVQRQLKVRPDGTRGLYLSPYCHKTRSEFGQYQYQTTRDDQARRTGGEVPLKIHDDAMDALRYAIYSTFGRGRSGAIPVAVSSSHSQVYDPIAAVLAQTDDETVRRILGDALRRAGLSADLSDDASQLYTIDLERQAQLLAERQRANGKFLRQLGTRTLV